MYQGETSFLGGFAEDLSRPQLPSTSSFRHYELEASPYCPPPSSVVLSSNDHLFSNANTAHLSASVPSSSSSSPFLFHHQFRQAYPLPPATSQPRFQQSLLPSHAVSARRLSAPYSPKKSRRMGGRQSPPLSDEESTARFVSPLSVEPRQKHLTRQKLKNTHLSSIPDSMVVQSSCNLHSYKVEDVETQGRLVLESHHRSAGVTVVIMEELDSSPPHDHFDSSDEEHDPVICGSPLLGDGYLSDGGSSTHSSRSRSPEFEEQNLVERLNHLEQLIGSHGN